MRELEKLSHEGINNFSFKIENFFYETEFGEIQLRFYKDSCPIVSDLIFKQSLRSINVQWVYLCNLFAVIGLNNVSLPEIKEERKIKYQCFMVLRINYLIINYVGISLLHKLDEDIMFLSKRSTYLILFFCYISNYLIESE